MWGCKCLLRVAVSSLVQIAPWNKLVNITQKKQTHRGRELTGGHQWGAGRGKGKIEEED